MTVFYEKIFLLRIFHEHCGLQMNSHRSSTALFGYHMIANAPPYLLLATNFGKYGASGYQICLILIYETVYWLLKSCYWLQVHERQESVCPYNFVAKLRPVIIYQPAQSNVISGCRECRPEWWGEVVSPLCYHWWQQVCGSHHQAQV